MAQSVYSTRFILAPALEGLADYTVPDGFVAVIREVDASIGATVSAFEVSLVVPGPVTAWLVSQAGSDGASFQFTGRVVVLAGESFAVRTDGAALDVICCGYLLSLP